ncbi:response regulator transcription factor [Paraburkholderia sp. RL17-337-BIB-A]|uniref:response regulator transcription factor n=1 Tax=Paraburkholderia sp. RL17-337-BIB-A TaxID=3031636 RepID=UPI0038BA1535
MAKSNCPPRSSFTRSFHKQYITIAFPRPSRLTATKPIYSHQRLTSRELDVFLRIACGQSLSDIANTLGASVKTIGSHRANILEKMELLHDVALVRYAVIHKLIPEDDLC